MRTSTIAATLLGLGSSAYAQQVSSTQSGITYSFSVPDTTASSGSGDVYISISGPTSFGWIGMGSGSSMSGSKMFVIYQNAAGTNVTLSPRTGSGHSMPSFDSSAQAVLVEGTGITGSTMTAVIKCSDCASKFDITSSSAGLIFAAKSGSIKSDSQSYSISQHDNTYGQMTIDMTQAKNSANTNPFASGSSTSTGSGTTSTGTATVSCTPISQTSGGAAQTSGGSGYFGPFGGSHPSGHPPFPTGTGGFPFGGSKIKRADNGCPSGYEPATNSGASTSQNGFSASQRTSMLMAHGIMAGLAFAVFFPFGAISIRLMSFPGLVAFHAIFQILAYLFYIIAFGLGVYLANEMRMLDETHPIIGILLFVLLFFQPILGWMHHRNFKRFQTRTMPSYVHVWLGRTIIPLGIVNGGLGLKLANNATIGQIAAYVIVAIVFFIAYVVAIIIGEKRRANGRRDAPPKYDEVLMENVTPPSSPPRHREFYAGGRK